MVVHVLHVGFGIFKGISQHHVLRLQMIDLFLEVFVLHAVALDLFSRRSDPIGHQTLDYVLGAVAVLEGIDEG